MCKHHSVIGTFCFHRVWVRNSETFYLYTKVEQISKYTVDKKNYISHCKRKKTQIRKGKGWIVPGGISLESDIPTWTQSISTEQKKNRKREEEDSN